MSALRQRLDKGHHLRDVFGRARIVIRRADPQPAERRVEAVDEGSDVGDDVFSGGVRVGALSAEDEVLATDGARMNTDETGVRF